MLSLLRFIKYFVLLLYIINNFAISQHLKPNILFIIIDDMRHLLDEEVNLFNIGKLAGKSINFKNAFVQALCAPSRNSILTGRRPDSLRLYDFYSYWRHFVGNFKTFPEIFKQYGYDTYSIGKVFHPGLSSNFTDDYPYSWTEMPYHPPSERFKDSPVCLDKHTKKMQRNLLCPVVVKKQPYKTLPDLQSLNYAIDILNNRSGDKPFLLAVGFHKPHIPLKYPKKYKDMTSMHNIRPPLHPYMPEKLPIVAWHPWNDVRSREDIKRLNISFPFGTMPYKWTLKIKQSYYAASLYIDNLVGKILNHIDKTNTVVVITSDHGWSLGENGLWAKYSNFDVVLKVPLIFSVPGFAPNIVHSPVELVDIFPTLIELAGLEIDIPKCQSIRDRSVLCYGGKSLVPLMKKKYENTNNFAISQYPRPSEYPQCNSDKPRLKDIKIMGYSIRTERYRYTEWIQFNSTTFTMNWDVLYGGELYDHQHDPNESDNLYMNFNYEHVKKYLSKLLRTNVDN